MAKNKYAVIMGKLGGSKKSEKKRLSSIENGKKGGRRKIIPVNAVHTIPEGSVVQ